MFALAKIRCRAWIILCSMLLLPRVAAAFHLFFVPLTIPERGTIASCLVKTETDQIRFLPPAGWRVDENSALQKITMVATNLSTTIVWQITPEVLSPEQWRERVVLRFAAARRLHDFDSYCAGQKCAAVEFELVTPHTVLTKRLVFVPMNREAIEIEFTAVGKLEDRTTIAFSNFLGSFQIEPLDRR
jgi:hypothetical protein